MNRIFSIVLVLVFSILVSSCSETTEAELALLPAPLPDFEPSLKLKTSWSVSTSAVVSGNFSQIVPATGYGKVFVTGSSGTVEARDIENGKLIWKTETNAVIQAGVSVANELVVVGSQEGDVIALDANTGNELWRNVVSSEVLAPAAIADGHVVVRTVDGKLFSMDQKTGKREWFFDRNVPILTLRGTSAPISAHGAVLSGFDNGKVALFFIETGKPIWEKRIAQSVGRSELERIVDMDAKPLIVDTRVYVVTYNGNLAALDLRSGETLWQREMSSFQNISNSGDRLFVTNAEDQVRALSINGGATLWSQVELKNRGLSAPTPAGDYVVAADFEGYLHWMDVKDGHFVFRQQIDSGGITGAPIVKGQQLFVQGRGGKLVAIEFPATTYQ